MQAKITFTVPVGFTGHKLAAFKKKNKEAIEALAPGAHNIDGVLVEVEAPRVSITLHIPPGMSGSGLAVWKLTSNYKTHILQMQAEGVTAREIEGVVVKLGQPAKQASYGK